LALEFDLACQYALNRHDLEIEKLRLSFWGLSDNAKPKTKTQPTAIKARNQTMTAKDIMRKYK
jgi:hypothetical protein